MAAITFYKLNPMERAALIVALMYPHKTYKEILPTLFSKDYPNMSDTTYRKYHKEGVQSLIKNGLLDQNGNPTNTTYATISGPLASKLIGDASKQIYFLNDMYNNLRDKSWDNERKISSYEEQIKKLIEEQNTLKTEIKSKTIVNYQPINNLPSSISEEINTDMKEAELCINSGAYKAGITMCGRAIEVLLHSIYETKTKSDNLDSNIGLGKLIGKMRKEKIELPEEISRIANFINDMRVISVHKKDKIYRPLQDEVKSIFELTKVVIKKLHF